MVLSRASARSTKLIKSSAYPLPLSSWERKPLIYQAMRSIDQILPSRRPDAFLLKKKKITLDIMERDIERRALQFRGHGFIGERVVRLATWANLQTSRLSVRKLLTL